MKIKSVFLKRRVIWLIIGAVIVSVSALLPFYGEDVLKELSYSSEEKDRPLTMQDLKQKDDLKKVAEAAGGLLWWQLERDKKDVDFLPWQFGGTVIKYQPLCTVDNQSGTCPASCPMCTQMLGQACNGYQEIQYDPATGSMPSSPPGTLCAPKGFPFKGGTPRSGAQILGGGASPQLPWVVGVSSF
jgi:hypothetical protein